MKQKVIRKINNIILLFLIINAVIVYPIQYVWPGHE